MPKPSGVRSDALSRGFSDPRRGRFTANRWSISTTPIRRRSRASSSKRSIVSIANRTRTSRAPCISLAKKRRRLTKARATSSPNSSRASRDDIVLTSGTTQAINLVAYCYALPLLKPGDQILVTAMEHHANIVPWQFVAERTGATVDRRADRAERRIDRRRIRAAADAEGEARRRGACVERARHGQSGARTRESVPRARNSAARRRLAGRAASGRSTCSRSAAISTR